jgi:PAS domain S-box-containing protein
MPVLTVPSDNDTSPQREAELTLKDSWFRSAFEHAAIGMALSTLDGRCLAANRSLCEMLGYEEAELLGTQFQSLSHPDDREENLRLARQLLSGEIPTFRIEKRYFHKRGHVVWVLLSASLACNAHGQPLYVISQIQDTTPRKQVEAELTTHARQQAAVAELGQRALVGADLPVLINTAIQLVVQVLGVEYCKVLRLLADGRAMLFQGGTSVKATPAGSPPPENNAQADYILLSRDPLALEEDLGAGIPLGGSSSPNPGTIHGASVILPGEGQSLGLLGAYTARQRTFTEDDLNFLQAIANVLAEAIERKRADEALHSSEERYRMLFENAVEGVAVLAEGRVALANPAFARILGYADARAIVGVTVRDLMPSKLRDGAADWFQQWQGEALSMPGIQSRASRQDRSEIDVLVYGVAIAYDGRPAVLIFLHDITEQLRNEQRVAAIRQIGQAITASLDLDEIFSRIVQGLERLLPFDQASLSLLEDGRCFCVTRSPLPANASPDLLRLSTPLVIQSRAIGTLDLVSSGPNRYSSCDDDLLEQLAPQIAIAVENARLYDELRTGRERLQSLSHRLVKVQEAERRHIARELHDEVGQALTGLKLLLEMMSRLPPETIQDSLSEAQAMANDLLARVQEMSLNLRPAMLDDLGLLPTLLWHIERYSALTNVCVAFKHTQLEGRFPPEVETAAYRLVQEALTNAARHADAREVTVRLWATADMLGVQVEDNGVGFDVEAALSAGESSGLSGMRERVALLAGHLSVESSPGAGTCLTAELPLRAPFESSKSNPASQI